jgi:site-specific recombinase XerD
MSQLPAPLAAGLPAALGAVAEQARAYIRESRAANTRRAYASDWQAFAAWCAGAGLEALPAAPETIALYLADQAQHLAVGTLGRRLVAITAAHRAAGHQLDTRHAAIRETLAGIKRTHGTAQQGKAPAVVAELRRMVEAQGDDLAGIRNRAILLLGFAGAFRRSEIAGLDLADLAFTADGLVVTLRRSKTDQEGAGRRVGVPYGSTPATCPVRSMRAWLDAAGITSGAVFREIGTGGQLVAAYTDAAGRQRGERLSDKSIANVVKAAAKAAGLDAARYAGHSLRAGLATSAAAAGASERSIMAQTGHRSVNMVRRYIRSGELFRENAAAAVGL